MSKVLKKIVKLKFVSDPFYRPLVESLLSRFEQDLNPDLNYKLLKNEIDNEIESPPSSDSISIDLHQDQKFTVSIAFLTKSRSHGAFFFYEMISRWLIPLKKVDVSLFFKADVFFQFESNGEIDTEDMDLLRSDDQLYTVGEGVVTFRNSLDYQMFTRHFPLVKQEILLGMTSRYHSSKILEMKGLSVGEKGTLIHEKILNMIHHFPSLFDYGIFSLMQKYLVEVSDSYKRDHESSHMAKVICLLHLLKKKLVRDSENNSKKRVVVSKYHMVDLQVPFGVKKTFGITFGLTFVRKNERFSKEHLLNAVNSIVPGISYLPSSFFSIKQDDGKSFLFYLEVEKSTPFTTAEKNKIRKELLKVALLRIEHLVKPVFMPRNEEEVMRNILTLSNQLKFVDDLPQVNTSFEKQTDKFLVFTVVLARVLKENASSIKHELNKGVTSFTYSVDRVKLVGKLRNKYPKEATVIRAFLPDRKFLRDDQSVDLFYARQNLVKELRAILGDFRDFNGGMLSKQKEAFDLFVNELHKDERIQRPLVEKFFHSIFPVEKRSLINPLEISFLYRMFLKMINAKSEKKELDSSGGVLYVLLSFEGVEKAEDFLDEITKLNLSRRDVTKIQLNVYDRTYIGLIINNSLDDENVEVFSTISSLVL